VEKMGKLSDAYNQKQRKTNDEIERERQEAERENEERRRREIREREREMWEEKVTEKKIEMETQAKASLAKLLRLKISPFKGTAADWF
jgi:hypothetical protein